MGLFGRRRKADEAPAEAEGDESQEAVVGPFDIADVDGTGTRLDLGALHIPPVAGMKIRVELDKNTQTPISVTCVIGRSSVQIQLFAAPRSASLWDEIRPLLEQSARDKNGTVDDVPGAFGRELLVKLPVTAPGGTGMKSVRFVGIDGPRWMLRGVFRGDAALGREAAEPLESMIRQIVVDRGREARPPREPIALSVPGQDAVEQASHTDNPLAILRRGPEITETR